MNVQTDFCPVETAYCPSKSTETYKNASVNKYTNLVKRIEKNVTARKLFVVCIPTDCQLPMVDSDCMQY